MVGSHLRTKSGDLVSDCSDCRLHCGDETDLGLAAQGVRIAQDWRGLWLIWHCPSCETDVWEQTEMFNSGEHAECVLKDPLCARCRT